MAPGFGSGSALDPHFWSPCTQIRIFTRVQSSLFNFFHLKTLFFGKNQASNTDLLLFQSPDPDPHEMGADPKSCNILE